jgi:hypothetical protein
MVIDFSKVKRNFSSLLINDVTIEHIKSTCILVVFSLQDIMNWSNHVNRIVKKAEKSLY